MNKNRLLGGIIFDFLNELIILGVWERMGILSRSSVYVLFYAFIVAPRRRYIFIFRKTISTFLFFLPLGLESEEVVSFLKIP